MIDFEFLRTEADERQRIQLLDAVVRWGLSAKGFPADLTVVVFGSLIRGDYWAGSDLDIIPIGGDVRDRDRAISDLTEIGAKHGAKSTERWNAVSIAELEKYRRTPPRERTAPYPPQFGFHGFDTIGHHVTILGKDPLVDFPVPQGEELQALAEERLAGFKNAHHPWFDIERKYAPEAIKVAVLLASVRRGLAPSRHKYAVAALFEQLVPDFSEKARWKEVWRRYQRGEGPLSFEVEFRDALIDAMCK